MVDRQALAGFIAALVHDVRKVDLGEDGTWPSQHEDLSKTANPFLQPEGIDFEALLGPEVVEIVLAHHRRTDRKTGALLHAEALSDVRATDLEEARRKLDGALRDGRTSLPKIALALADRWQKAMFKAIEKEERYFERTKKNPLFYPYWGEVEAWEIGRSAKALQAVAQTLGADGGGQEGYPAHLDLERLLAVQEQFRRFPHTTYLPHSPLSIHHRFTALLYLFIYRRLCECASPLDLEPLEFSLLRITPDPLSLLYRMRDVNIARRAMGRLRETLAGEAVVGPYRQIVPDISAEANPFEFFADGDDVVLVTDRTAEVLGALREFVNADLSVRSLTVERLDFTLRPGWSVDKGYLEFSAFKKQDEQAEVVETRLYTHQILGAELTNFHEISGGRCQRCGRPVEEEAVTVGSAETLCPDCKKLRSETPAMLNLERVARAGPGEDLIGFVFLNLPPDLRQHAGRVAEERLIPDFVSRKLLEPGEVAPSPARFFEVLAAVDDLQHLHALLTREVAALTRRKWTQDGREGTYRDAAATLFASSGILAYVLHWDLCWPFLSRLNAERERLRLDSCLTVVFCRHKMPFWSLMDRYARYRKAGEDWYFDAAGRSIVMFTQAEVNDIRRLAVEARKAGVSNAELEGLVQTALLTDPHELHLEIEARAADRKLGERHGFPGRLRAALDRLDHEGLNPQQRRQKRAVFIKYIRKLKGGR